MFLSLHGKMNKIEDDMLYVKQKQTNKCKTSSQYI